MDRSARQFPFGEEVAIIPLGMECLQVCAAPCAPGRFNVLRCPGPIVELCTPATRMLATVAELVADEARCCLGVQAVAWTHGDVTIHLRLDGRELTLDPNDAVAALRVITDAARQLFMPAFDRQIDLTREMSTHT